MTRIAILGGGPGGYEAALVAAQLGADVTLVERDGPGGACVLADCVPSKTLIATAESVHGLEQAGMLGLRLDGGGVGVDISRVNGRVRDLARAQSADIGKRLVTEGVTIVPETGRLLGPGRVEAGGEELRADVVLVSVGARPRTMPGVEVDGERILTWRHVYDLA
ncbi:MAG TPA: FAD-dependent oxidoreductase, partial [Mycobacteriales bacterium]|nr:FAD-dependent oxidoreductase [Mycobacteriales bacterium]